MNDAHRVSSNTPASLDIKSANLPMVALMLKSTDLQAIEAEMARRFGDVPDFFDDDLLLIDLSSAVAQARRLGEPEAEVDFAGLLALLKPYKVRPVAIRGGTESQMQAAQAAGLLPAADARVVASSPHVYSPLRGKAIAGARGNSQDRIYAQSLEAELLSIAGIYRTSDVPLPEKVRGKPAQIRLHTDASGDKLIMEPLG